jgi:hypothetical protein
MRHIDSEMNSLMKEVIAELQIKDVKFLMNGLQQNTMICHKLEPQAFNELSRIAH